MEKETSHRHLDAGSRRLNVSFRDWLSICLKIGALSVGGSGRLLLFQDAIVEEKKWISEEDFQKMLTISTVFPGPNLVNLCAYLGIQLSGLRAAVVGLLALCLPGSLMALALIYFFDIDNRHLKILLQGFSLASIFMFSIFVWRLLKKLQVSSYPQQFKSYKKVLRILLALGIGLCSLLAFPLPSVILLAILVALGVEFIL